MDPVIVIFGGTYSQYQTTSLTATLFFPSVIASVAMETT